MTFKLAYPCKPWIIHQKFGDCHPSVCSIYKGLGLKGHNGLDLFAPDGTFIYAAHDGIVTFAGEDGSAGLGVVIRTHEPYNGVYFKTIYWHLKTNSIIVRPNQHVKTGDLIALADNTGLSKGSHLHFGLKPVQKGEADWEWWNSEQDNGYKGAIDPVPFFTGDFAQDLKAKKVSDRIVEVQLPKGDPDQNKIIIFAWILRMIGL